MLKTKGIVAIVTLKIRLEGIIELAWVFEGFHVVFSVSNLGLQFVYIFI